MWVLACRMACCNAGTIGGASVALLTPNALRTYSVEHARQFSSPDEADLAREMWLREGISYASDYAPKEVP